MQQLCKMCSQRYIFRTISWSSWRNWLIFNCGLSPVPATSKLSVESHSKGIVIWSQRLRIAGICLRHLIARQNICAITCSKNYYILLFINIFNGTITKTLLQWKNNYFYLWACAYSQSSRTVSLAHLEMVTNSNGLKILFRFTVERTESVFRSS